ncbi:hypothetical protein [Candidatus Phytoplasma sacchari]|nr:hypothetical protein [Candidatus Phytoplasma sacchari]KAB8122241.1 hypothetical protein F2B49_01685 [Candidatus Phytoplasma sacchari]
MNKKKKKIIILNYLFFLYIIFLFFLILFLLFLFIFSFFPNLNFSFGLSSKKPSHFLNYSTSLSPFEVNFSKSKKIFTENNKRLMEKSSGLSSFRNFQKNKIKNRVLNFLKKNNVDIISLDNDQIQSLDKIINQFYNFKNHNFEGKNFHENLNKLNEQITNLKKIFNINNDKLFLYSSPQVYTEDISTSNLNNYSNKSKYSSLLSDFFDITGILMDNLHKNSVKGSRIVSPLISSRGIVFNIF